MQLSDLVKALADAPPELLAEIQEQALPALADKVWVPNPGPQTDAYYSLADELFYGGQAGGGKTDLELGLALTCHERALILRRTNTEVNGLIERMETIVGNRDGLNGSTGVWRRPKGVSITLGGCQLENDKQKRKGNPNDLICVGRDTPVLMSDGSYKPVQEVLPGDSVATLEGPREVKKAFPVFGRESIELSVGGVKQIQSASHKVLSHTGWAPLGTPGAAPSSMFLTDTTQYHSPSISPSKTSYISLLVLLVLRKICPWGQNTSQPLPTGHNIPRTQYRQGTYAGKASPGQGSGCVRSGGGLLTLWRKAVHFGASLARLVRPRIADALSLLRFSPLRGVSSDRSESSPEGCRDRCSVCPRPCGGRTPCGTYHLHAPGVDQLSLRLSIYAALRSPIRWLEGALARTRICNHHSPTYPHPYTKSIRLSQLSLISQSFSVTPIGKKNLFDLEIEEVNHFITRGGIVNQNCFDEVSDFSETQYTFIIGWNRSATPGQRCRIVAAGNPPTRPEGLWVLRRWAAWLDPEHPNPAEPGELRWYTTEDEVGDFEVDGPGPHIINGHEVYARSRTYIPATLKDNPDLINSGYQASLDALPVELRAAYRDGDFGTGLRDDPYQAIPTDWIVEAQRRWTPNPPPGVPMCAIGVDVAISKDRFVVAPRHDGWFAKMLSIPGSEVADPKKAAGRVIAMRYDEAKVIVDVGGGWGADCYAQLVGNGVDAIGYMGVKASSRKSNNNRFTFSNVRSEAIWRLREALDPSQPGGSTIQLPPSVTLKADLSAPTYKVKGHQKGQVLIIESKVEVCARLGRSTDEGDAVVMSWWDGIKQHNLQGGWSGGFKNPVVNGGRSLGKRRR